MRQLLSDRAALAHQALISCRLCSRDCGVNRLQSRSGGLARGAAGHLDRQEFDSLHEQGRVRDDAARRKDMHVERLHGSAVDERDALCIRGRAETDRSQ